MVGFKGICISPNYLNQPNENEANFCPSCNQELKNLLLTIKPTEDLIEEYYACPKCLTKIKEKHKINDKNLQTAPSPQNLVEKEKIAVPTETSTQVQIAASVVAEKEKPSGCNHNLKYLKTREKGAVLPDECLVCEKMIDCTH